MIMLSYKDYSGLLEIDEESEILFGRVLDIKDVITFEGTTIAEAKQAFQDSVEDYLEFCQELGQEPNKPSSGKLPYRTSSETHRKVFLAATKANKSINAWMDEVLIAAADRSLE